MNLNNIPESVAIIMDGNGRWAEKRNLARTFGHKEGCKRVEELVENAAKLGIKYLTVYAFSTENWNRSGEEVSALMDLFRYYAQKLLKKAKTNNVSIKFIGNISKFPEDIRLMVNELEKETGNNTGLKFVIAANYGGRDEIRRAAIKYAKDCLSKADDDFTLTERDFSAYLDTSDIPDPDLIIRTSGEIRISNFLLWQSAYSEFVPTDTLWPDFNMDSLTSCIEVYNKRKRRFGGV